MEAKLQAVSNVDIDEGRFKYILIKVNTDDDSLHKHIVRGYKRAGFHADIYDEVAGGIEGLGLDCECVGGGRIQHDSAQKTLHIYGYSMGFGKADHSITKSVLQTQYPDYTITWSDEGY